MTTTLNARRNSTGESLSHYFADVESNQRVSPDEERSLALAWRDRGCQASRERLITANLRLVIMLARRYLGRGASLEDLIAEGNLGLVHAVDHFHPMHGARFSTYAVYWIRHSIAEAFARAAYRSRMSRTERADVHALRRSLATFQAQHGRAPVAAELCDELHWKPERVREVMTLESTTMRPSSLDAVSTEVGGSEQDPSGSSDDNAALRVSDLLGALSEEERRIVQLRYGLSGSRPRSIGEVSDEIQLPQRAVRVRLEAALRKLNRRAAASASATSPLGTAD